MYDCRNIACSEIRAVRNSECHKKWFKTKCIRELSTEAVKTSCPEMATFFVSMNYKTCSEDHAPFQEI
jgi:hypothetical protein